MSPRKKKKKLTCYADSEFIRQLEDTEELFENCNEVIYFDSSEKKSLNNSNVGINKSHFSEKDVEVKTELTDDVMVIFDNNDTEQNSETNLFRTLIEIAYENEIEIIKHLKSFYSKEELKGKFSLVMGDSGNERFHRFKGKISQNNLQDLLHVREVTFEKWVKAGWRIENLHTNTFVNIVSSVNHFPEGNIRGKFWNAVMEYVKTARKELEFTTELLLIFNENTKELFNYQEISVILGFYKSWLVQNFHYEREFETHNKYFNLLVGIFLITPTDIKFRNKEDLNILKIKCLDLVFQTMVNKDMINPQRKAEVEILLWGLIVINKFKMKQEGANYKKFELVDLSEKLSDYDYRYIFSDGFREDYSIRRQSLKLYDLLNEICEDVDIPECEEAKNKIKQYLSYWQRDYHDHWQDLYPIHIKDLLLLTLGLNVANFQFFEDATLDWWKVGDKTIFIYRMDVDRHHLDFDSKNYLPFDFDEENGYIPKIIPLSHGEHSKLTNLYQSRSTGKLKDISNLYKARLIHIFELIHSPISSFNIENLHSELKNRSITIKGKETYIWEGLEVDTIEELRDRLVYRSSLPEEQFLDAYYKVFYQNKYHRYLKLMKRVSPKFIYWYENHYLKEIDDLFERI